MTNEQAKDPIQILIEATTKLISIADACAHSLNISAMDDTIESCRKALADALAAPIAAVVAPEGWKFSAKDDEEDRTWLTITTPYGACAMLSCRSTHHNGQTIAAQVVHLLAAAPAHPVAGTARRCSGIPDPRCNYMATCGSVCNKCGRVHNAMLFAASAHPVAEVPFKLVNITSPGFEGHANLIYTGKDWESGCVAMLPPFIAEAFRKLMAGAAPASPAVATVASVPDAGDVVTAIGDRIRWMRNGMLVVERGYHGAEKVLLEQRDAAIRALKDQSIATAAPSIPALAEMEARKDAAYFERNQVVAALAKCFPSGAAKTSIDGWSEEWHGCVYIDLPTGQVSWHYHDSHAHLFNGLPPYLGEWDGHTTDEKYARLAVLAPSIHEAGAEELPPLTDDEIINAAYAVDATRAHELGGKTLTIFDSDAHFVACVRAALKGA